MNFTELMYWATVASGFVSMACSLFILSVAWRDVRQLRRESQADAAECCQRCGQPLAKRGVKMTFWNGFIRFDQQYVSLCSWQCAAAYAAAEALA